jgi:hypothetical protein
MILQQQEQVVSFFLADVWCSAFISFVLLELLLMANG